MALLGKQSTAHIYDRSGQCIYCGMYKKTVLELSHVCTRDREIAEDGGWHGIEPQPIMTSEDVNGMPVTTEVQIGQ